VKMGPLRTRAECVAQSLQRLQGIR